MHQYRVSYNSKQNNKNLAAKKGWFELDLGPILPYFYFCFS